MVKSNMVLMVEELLTWPLGHQIELIVSASMISLTYTFASEHLDWSPVDCDGYPYLCTLDMLLTRMSRVDKRVTFEYLLSQGLLRYVSDERLSWWVSFLAKNCKQFTDQLFDAIRGGFVIGSYVEHCGVDVLNTAVKRILKKNKQ